jgi:hypothetical protein
MRRAARRGEGRQGGENEAVVVMVEAIAMGMVWWCRGGASALCQRRAAGAGVGAARRAQGAVAGASARSSGGVGDGQAMS